MARRRRHLPRMAGHSVSRGHYRHNPAKGINWMPILLIGGAALLFMRPGGLGFGGTSVLPAGYTYLGSGYYRGPDGQTYYRSPVTGQMSPATAAQVASGQFTQAGQQVVSGVMTAAVPAVTTGIVSLFGGLVKAIGGAFNTEQAPVASDGTVSTSDYLRSGDDVGMAPAPLPDFPVAVSYDYALPTYGYDYTIPEPIPMTFDLAYTSEPAPMESF